MNEIEKLQSTLKNASPESIIFFGGAGVSTESGIPDFRSADGLYSQKFAYPPETMLSRTFFDKHPREFFDFYFGRVVFLDAEPNRAHKKLAELERDGKLISVVTQNIDGLHQAAGSKRVHELHGSIMRNFCMGCGRPYSVEEMLELRQRALKDDEGIPHCPNCGCIIKPDVVLYEEPLDQSVMMQAIQDIRRADIMLIAGTSLVVNPAASLVNYFNGDTLAIVNMNPTPADNSADILISASIGDALNF